MSCLRRCSHVSNLSAKHHRRSLWQQMENRSRTWVKRTFMTNEGIQRCITFRSASVVKPVISMQNVARVGHIVVLDEKIPHIRNIRDGTVIKLDMNNGVYTMGTCGFALMKQVQFSAGKDSEWSSRFRQACKTSIIVQR